MDRRRSQRGQAAVELIAVLPLLFAVGVVVAVVALSSHSWVRAESAARVGARATVVGAPAEAAAERVAPTGARVRIAERGQGDRKAAGVEVEVSRGGEGPYGLEIPAIAGWSPTR